MQAAWAAATAVDFSVLVEQNAKAALKLAHRGYVLEVGRIILHGEARELLTNPEVRNAYLGGA